MFSPRNLIIAGVVLIAVALGSSGHGLWWLFGLLWVLPHAVAATATGTPAGRASRRRHDHGLPHDEPDARSRRSPTRRRTGTRPFPSADARR